MSNTSTVLITLVAGVAVGAALGLLLAPASGKVTREKLMKKGGRIRDKVAEMVDEAREMAGETADNVEKAAGQAKRAAGYGGQQSGTGSAARA